MASEFIPFNRPYATGKEHGYIQNALDSLHVSGDGRFSKLCHQWIEQRSGCARALLTHSCTSALDLAAMLLDLKSGDEVIVPSFTFVSSANAFVLRGATPVFVDVRADTLNLDERLLERAITPRTKAIVTMHYAGVACEMDEIMRMSSAHGVAVIEDNAHGIFGKYRGQMLGTFGVTAALSFNETTNFTCGEGGAILINDRAFIERAEIIREKGTNRSRFFRGEVDKYTWVDVGSSYLMSDVLAAFLYGQLEARQLVQARRREIWNRYDAALADWAAQRQGRRPIIPPHCEQSH